MQKFLPSLLRGETTRETEMKTAEPQFLSTKKHCRYFKIAGITVRIESDLDLNTVKFKDELLTFAVEGPGDDNVTLCHHFELPDITGKDLGKEVYRRPPWAISIKDEVWCYKGILPDHDDSLLHRLAFFSADHTCGTIYSPPFEQSTIRTLGFQSLSLFPTDQIWLGPLLADRNAVLIHSAAAIINGCGVLFVGHSDAGKSTTMEMLKKARRDKGLDVEILCDDRNVVRKGPDGWRVYGTWSHGTTADVSSANAPLHAIMFLEQSLNNEIQLVTDRKFIWKKLLATLIRPMVTAKWWEKELDILQLIVNEVPHYNMRFDRTGAIIKDLQELLDQ